MSVVCGVCSFSCADPWGDTRDVGITGYAVMAITYEDKVERKGFCSVGGG
jgi:hypothetical protein